MEVFRAPAKADALALLSQYIRVGRGVLCGDFFGSADMLHFCRALCMFVHGYWFVNPWYKPICPVGGMFFWKTRQGGREVGENITTT